LINLLSPRSRGHVIDCSRGHLIDRSFVYQSERRTSY